MEIFAVISVISGVFVTIFWMVVGWRAMRAHEHLAATNQALLAHKEKAEYHARKALLSKE
jgi:hypothetical protein